VYKHIYSSKKSCSSFNFVKETGSLNASLILFNFIVCDQQGVEVKAINKWSKYIKNTLTEETCTLVHIK